MLIILDHGQKTNWMKHNEKLQMKPVTQTWYLAKFIREYYKAAGTYA